MGMIDGGSVGGKTDVVIDFDILSKWTRWY